MITATHSLPPGGLLNTLDLITSPQALTCYLYQFLSSVVPSLLREQGGLLGNVLGSALGLIRSLITEELVDPNCPKLGLWNDAVLGRFPGAGMGR